jgi:hypothetical protein
MHRARPRRCDRVIVCELLTVDTVLLRRIYVLIFVEHGCAVPKLIVRPLTWAFT